MKTFQIPITAGEAGGKRIFSLQCPGRCHVVESLMRVRQVPQLKSCGGDDFAPRLHG
jgi:hypothetical protein